MRPRMRASWYGKAKPVANIMVHSMTKPNSNTHGKKIAFVCIPRELAIKPPIRHRGALADGGLSVFEFVVAATCATLARAGLNNIRHEYALSVGKKAIKRERLQASKDLQTKIGGVSYQFKLAGMDGYREGREAFAGAVQGECLVVELSVQAFFRRSGLARNSRSTALLPSTFDRLTMGTGSFGPVLRQWTKIRNGQLCLHINEEWLPQRRFARVPWPLPTSGATVLALYLFLSSTDQRSEVSIKTENLYSLLGIPLNRPAHAQRALDRALVSVNLHLKFLNRDRSLEECELPTKYVIQPLRDRDRLCFRAPHAKLTRSARANRIDEVDEQDAHQEELERFRSALNLGEDEYLDDEEVEEIQHRQKRNREVDRRRQQEEETRAEFQAMTARLREMK